MSYITATFSTSDLVLLAEALKRAASRHESEAKASTNPDNGKMHKSKAKAMDGLRNKILRMQTETMPAA